MILGVDDVCWCGVDCDDGCGGCVFDYFNKFRVYNKYFFMFIFL